MCYNCTNVNSMWFPLTANSPSHLQTWPDGLKLAAAMNFRFPQFAPTPLNKIITNACPEAIDLITQLCQWDPNKRPTAVQVRATRLVASLPLSGAACTYPRHPRLPSITPNQHASS